MDKQALFARKKTSLPLIPISQLNKYRKSPSPSPSPMKIKNHQRQQSSKYKATTIQSSLPSPNSIPNSFTSDTKKYVESMKAGSSNILVAVRVRPLSQYEQEISPTETVKILDEKMVILIDPIEYNGPSDIFKNRSREQSYAFDYAFDKFTNQQKVFENTTKFLIEGVANGYNATVFAYGATGAGKTYTMTGTDDNPGIMSLTIHELFKVINQYKGSREYNVKLWYLEIYNEIIRDLLKFANGSNANNSCFNLGANNNSNLKDNDDLIELREDPVKGIIVSNITEIQVSNASDILKLLKKGNRNRTQESTCANMTSSRSHAILQVSVDYVETDMGINYTRKYGKLSLIDLAGSERASSTNNKGIRLIEGANINKSLLTLGNCINALCDNNMKPGGKVYVPYRDSKLTRLLKDSLGGNSRTVMIANVSPGVNNFEDTYNTLKYANRAKNIKTYAVRNTLKAENHIANYVNIIKGLKMQVDELRKVVGERGLNLSMDNGEQNGYNNNYNNYNSNKGNDGYNFNGEGFEKIVNEAKKYCDKQMEIKNQVIEYKKEYNDILNNMKDNNIYSTNCEGITNTNLNKSYNQRDVSNEESNLNDGGNEINITNINYNGNGNISNQKENLLEIDTKINNLNGRLNEYDNLIERISSNLNKNQKDFINLIRLNTQKELTLIDNKFETSKKNDEINNKNDYILQLENQIKYRDEYLSNLKVEITDKRIKNLEAIKKEYKNTNTNTKNKSLFSNKNTNSNYYYRLPPITNRNYNIYYNVNKAKSPNRNSNKSSLSINNDYNNINNKIQRLVRNKSQVGNKEIGSAKNKKCVFIKNPSRRSSNGNIINDSNHKLNAANKNNISTVDVDKNNIETDNNKLFLLNNNININNYGSSLNSGGRIPTVNQAPQIKKKDLNCLIYEKNLERKKIIDQINNIKNDN